MPRILGIDYGSKRVGLAVTDELQMLSSPLDVYQNDGRLMENLARLCKEYSVGKIVIGYPYSETYQDAVRKVEEFGQRLRKFLDGCGMPLEIEYANEEFSSVFAESNLRAMGIRDKKIKGAIDKYAAQKILEDYLKHTSGK